MSVAIPGRLSYLEVSQDGGAVYHRIGGLVDATLNINIDELETTSHDSDGHREYLPNHDDATVDGSMRWLEGDPGQEILLMQGVQKILMQFRFRLQNAPGRKLFVASGFPTSFGIAGPLNDTVDADISIRLSRMLILTQ
jgi:hypothetical protein